MSIFRRKIVNTNNTDYIIPYFFQFLNNEIPSKAKNLWAVYACINVIAETIGSLPLPVYRKNKNGNREKIELKSINSLILQPNPRQNRFDFFEEMVWHLALRGQYYGIKNNIGKNTKEILSINPDLVIINESNYFHPIYTINGIDYESKDLLIVQKNNGESVISSQRKTINLADSLSSYSENFFKNGARPGGIVETDNKMDEAAYERFKKQWTDFYSGSNNVGKTVIFDQGKKYKPLSLSNVDAQFLEITKKTDVEICGIFRVPPHMIGILDNATFSNIENQSLNFTKYTIAPWCKRIELAITNQIIKPQLGNEFYCEYNMDALERADIVSRYNAHNIGRNAGFLSANEIRKKENLNPVENGDDYLIPANMNIAGGAQENED